MSFFFPCVTRKSKANRTAVTEQSLVRFIFPSRLFLGTQGKKKDTGHEKKRLARSRRSAAKVKGALFRLLQQDDRNVYYMLLALIPRWSSVVKGTA